MVVWPAHPASPGGAQGDTTPQTSHQRSRREISHTLIPGNTFTSQSVRITAPITAVSRESVCAGYRTHRTRTERDRANDRSIRCFGQVGTPMIPPRPTSPSSRSPKDPPGFPCCSTLLEPSGNGLEISQTDSRTAFRPPRGRTVLSAPSRVPSSLFMTL